MNPDTSQGINANTQISGNVLTGFGPPPPSSVKAPQVPSQANQFIQEQAPRATTFSGPLTPTVSAQKDTSKPLYASTAFAPAPSILSQFGHKISAIAEQGASIAAIPGNILLDIGKSTAQFIYRTGEYTSKVLMNSADSISNQASLIDLQTKQNQLVAQYKTGMVGQVEYNKQLKLLQVDYQNLQSQEQALNVRGLTDAKALAYNAGQTALLILTLDSSGIATGLSKLANGEAMDTAMVQGVTKLLGVENGVRFAQAGEAMSKLIAKVPAFGKIIEASVGPEILASTDSILSQSTHAAAAVFIKKPLLYNANISQAKDVYERMAKGDFGHALVGVGLLAVQAVGGGPFGYARDKIKAGGAILKDLTFGSGSFIDELSARVFDGNKAGIFNYLDSLPKDSEEYINTVQRLKELEHANMTATGGRVGQAVDRVTNSLTDSGFNLQEMTHADVVKNGINWAESAARVQEDIKAGKMLGVDAADASKYTVGRLDTQNKYTLAKMFEQVDKTLEGSLNTATLAKPGAKEINSYAKTFNVTKKQALEDLLKAQPQIETSTVSFTDKIAARKAAWAQFAQDNPNVAFTNNVNLTNKIEQMITNIEDTSGLKKAIQNIVTATELDGLPAATKKFLADKGFVLIRPQNIAAPLTPFAETSQKLLTNFATQGEGFFSKTTEPLPILSHFGSFLEKSGVSPRDASALTQSLYKDNLVNSLEQMQLTTKFESITSDKKAAENMIHQLEVFAKNRTIPITDLRQLPIGGSGIKGAPKGIAEALQISRDEARQVAGALNDAMIRVPLQYRGLGDRLVDLNMKYNPFAAGYTRIQNTFRYAWNPFFKWKLDTKTEVFAQLETGGKQISYPGINKFNELVFPGKTNELKTIVGQLEKSGILTTGFGGEGAQDLVVGQIGARLSKAQKMSLAGVADAMATTQGLTVEQLITNHPQQVTDTLRILVQYPKTGIINSPLVRTLNVAFFPTRFNIKVAELTAKALAKQSPYMQVAVIKGLHNFNGWLKTPEGTAWQSQHSDVLSLIEYISPLHTLSQTLANLQGHAESVSDLGELGGLPFGVISQMLSSQGILPNLNTPYIDPHSGNVVPNYVPKTSKAIVSTAIQDLIMSVFTYPGATIGLPSKTSTVRKLVNKPLGVKSADYNKVTPTLSTADQKISNTIKDLQPQSPLGASAFSANPSIYHTPTLSNQNQAQPLVNRGQTLPTLSKSQIAQIKASNRSGKKRPQPIPTR